MSKSNFDKIEINADTLHKTAIQNITWKNITEEVNGIVAKAGLVEGSVFLKILHTTAVIILNEPEQGLVEYDIPRLLNRLCPKKSPNGEYKHDSAERLVKMPGEPKNAPSHLRSIMLNCTGGVEVLVHESELVLGTFERILFFDLDPDNHYTREIAFQIRHLCLKV
ncbi:hypothetical protein A2926_00200 [Candidatus Giovannonibacteria bacterium RIFCSPLOWO2_01_FULL_44_40]|uniref:Secondary thiamine-phosphate synthase enzyme n=1 Tax=Candidatus Giovannonibacteria bacterium RIFCSPHIGHO2_01_FULL_45_23 TaxID=1798325 RepID=A0A1F5VH20_9BACT|nr:MAG: hypothetical protein A2834_01155 [Candidatus Giovannonibacteria bacterium RIFCSPHIGHO2_01_FULL_45_23]OGF75148.1 MAG: hypothetical protein A3C77_01365 [Candidatus Giovannonibacteria bacterium RIFCSPHIGHO2_02_FULL_45_13]OGF79712.1 MAG: hypothetical protein A2926_00200 [Candidatus Giovannonibacteria bacterium RIFCSPLOWO2_01_FULL_44_40]